jgi:glycosyltransferase involved in cell wall biosynthesis
VISVLTAVTPEHVEFLRSAFASLLRQEGSWEWIVQIDGTAVDLPLGGDERVRIADNGRHLGTSITRNRALLRANGHLVLSLDADDELMPGALTRLRGALESQPGAAYALGQTLDLFPDDRRLYRFTRRPYAPGPLDPGRLESEWRSSKNLFVQPGATLYRRDVVLAAGGWPAVTGMEDQELLLAVALLSPGVYVDEPVYLYRQHAGQTVRTAHFEDEREDNRRWCDARLRALRLAHGADPAALERMTTPIPGPEEMAGFVTDEWRAASARLERE